MRNSQTLQLEVSEKRSALAAVTKKLNEHAAAGTEPEAEDVSKADGLTSEIRTLEIRYRAAVIAEDAEDEEARAAGDVDAETAEAMRLEERAQLVNYVAAGLEMRAVAGDTPEAELNAALKVPGGRFPLRLLAPSEAELRSVTETRATTDADTTVMPRRWLDRLMYGTAAARIGVTFESVPAGVASYPITTGGAAAAQRSREEAIADAAWTIGVSELKPLRNGVRAKFTAEDVARLPGLESALRRDLRAALTEGMDRMIFAGGGGTAGDAANIIGLHGQAIGEVTLKQADKVKGDKTLEAFASLIDGLHAEGMGSFRTVLSVPALTLWLATIHNAAADNQTIAQFLGASGLMFTARGGLANSTAAGQMGAYIGLQRGIMGAAVAPVWDSAELIRDMYTGAASGEVALTLASLWNFGLPRPANFKRLKFVA